MISALVEDTLSATNRKRANIASVILFSALTYFCAGPALSEEQMECGSFQYRYEGSFLGEDEVSSLFAKDIEWKQFCVVGPDAAKSRMIDFPISECLYETEYLFRIPTSSPGRLEWKKANDDAPWQTVGPWNNHNATEKEVTSDARTIFQDLRQLNSGITSWSTTYVRVHRLNFEIKREQFEKTVSTILEDGTRSDTSDTDTYDCK